MTSQTQFSEKLAFGQIAESQIAIWLRKAKEYSIMPAYEKEIDNGKGPRLFLNESELVLPDMLAIRGDKTKWIEAKHKTVFTWHRITRSWQTGIDQRHYRDYLKVEGETPWPVWLLFLHRSNTPDPRDVPYCPGPCPIGLFGNPLSLLKDSVDHEDRYIGNGRSFPMVYWQHKDLRLLATLDEVNQAATLVPTAKEDVIQQRERFERDWRTGRGVQSKLFEWDY